MHNTGRAKIKVTFVLATLRAGGAERVYSYISQNLDKSKFQCTLVVLGRKEDAVFDTSGIDTVFFEKSNASKAVLRFARYLRKNKPHLVCGSVIHVNVIMGAMKMFFPAIRFVGREVSVISLMDVYMPKTILFQKQIRKFFYNRLDGLICQSTDMAIDLHQQLGMKQGKLEVIANPITLTEVELSGEVAKTSKLRIITVGRLSAEKGHRRVLDVLSHFKRPFHYTVIGDGPLREELTAYAKKLNLADKVSWLGHSSQVVDHLRESDVFVQGSKVEGFPNALLEANYCGIPVLTFNAPGGTKEIVQDGINGHIFEENSDMLTALEQFDHEAWQKARIKESVQSRYSPEVILAKYESYFNDLINDR